MKKNLLLFVSFLIATNLISCGTSISIGEKTPYTIVNDFPGATMKVIEVNTDEEFITVEFSYSGENELSYGTSAYEHEIEIYQDNEWHTLDYKKYDSIGLGYSVKDGETHTEDYKYTRYGKLPAGHYRIVKEVMNFIETGNYTEHYLAAEFDIE